MLMSGERAVGVVSEAKFAKVSIVNGRPLLTYEVENTNTSTSLSNVFESAIRRSDSSILQLRSLMNTVKKRDDTEIVLA